MILGPSIVDEFLEGRRPLPHPRRQTMAPEGKRVAAGAMQAWLVSPHQRPAPQTMGRLEACRPPRGARKWSCPVSLLQQAVAHYWDREVFVQEYIKPFACWHRRVSHVLQQYSTRRSSRTQMGPYTVKKGRAFSPMK